jgi:hypothetical protein
MAVSVTSGDAGEALHWINTSTISQVDKKSLKRFVEGFPTLSFYKQTLGGNPPLWFAEYCGVLAGVERGQLVWVQFDGFDYDITNHPLEGKISDTWYRLTKQTMVSSEHEQVYLKDKMLFFVGVDMEHYKTMLALCFDESNRSIYEFDYVDVHPNVDEDEEELEKLGIPMDGLGHLDSEAAFVVFDSYCTMLGHIKAIRFQDGRVLEREEKDKLI